MKSESFFKEALIKHKLAIVYKPQEECLQRYQLQKAQ